MIVFPNNSNVLLLYSNKEQHKHNITYVCFFHLFLQTFTQLTDILVFNK